MKPCRGCLGFSTSTESSIDVGNVLPVSRFLNNCWTREDPSKEWLHGISTSCEDNKLEIVFNKDPKSWHYAWRSHKNTSTVSHCFKVYCGVVISQKNKSILLKEKSLG